MEKIKNIEFLRILGCLSVIFLHFKVHFQDLSPVLAKESFFKHIYLMFAQGGKGVELFFILSGVFFILTLNTKKSCWEFVKKKLIRLQPVLIFAIMLAAVFSFFGLFKFKLYDNILALFMLNGTSLRLSSGNIGVFWYVSAMFWTLLLFFYLRKYYEKKHVNLFAAIAIFFCYSFLIHITSGKIGRHEPTYYYVFNVGLLRALGGISIGYFIGEWYKNNLEKIKNYVPTLKIKVSITVIEFMCLFFIINNLFLHYMRYNNDFIFVLIFSLIIMLFLAKKGYISDFLNKFNWDKIACYTYSIYVTHKLILNVITNGYWKNNLNCLIEHPFLNMSLALLIILAIGIFTYHLVEIPAKTYLTNMSESCMAVERERERE